MSQQAPAAAPGAASRGHAARAVAEVLRHGATLEQAFTAVAVDQLTGPDRAQAKALAFGALRWHHRHRELLRLLLDRPLPAAETLVEALLSVGLFQLLDEGQADYAAVSATVDAARWLGRGRAAGLVNATLRRLQREREALLAQVMAGDVGRHSHPAWLIRRLRCDWPERWREVLDAAQRPPPLWLRVNSLRLSAMAYQARLAEAGMGGETLAGVAQAVKLQRPVPVAAIPGFAAGEVTVQDAGSQLAAQLLAPEPGMRVLDACAAPGGKTTHLLERAGGDLDLLALDLDADRLARLRENLQRLGLRAHALAADATTPERWWDGRLFDAILVDAPCSGSGVIRRHPDIKWLRRERDIAPLAGRQRGLLKSLWPLLRSGGRLLYVTCSILREENDAVTAGFLAECPDAVFSAAPVPDWVLACPGGGWQALPGGADTDGLYYALMTRRE
jgi:16S rRNA (cytosine967-C5)-methyltransferase